MVKALAFKFYVISKTGILATDQTKGKTGWLKFILRNRKFLVMANLINIPATTMQ